MTIVSSDVSQDLNRLLTECDYDILFVLTDTNTQNYCLQQLQKKVPAIDNATKLNVTAGDEHKTIETAIYLWSELGKKGATRHSLLLNIGGGMITDLGGFVASAYKRGMKYINVSTTLLGAVDAATGGKTAVNFNGLKNEIGVFQLPAHVIVATDCFATLSPDNLLSGYAEMIKHALISSEEDLRQTLNFDVQTFNKEELITLLKRNIEIKTQIVEKDPKEQGIRKALNFGHTIGHAIESYSYTTPHPILHGYAVLWGMIAELYLSHIKQGFPKTVLNNMLTFAKQHYGLPTLSCKSYDTLYNLMKHDKKNMDIQHINFTLLADVGKIAINQTATKEEIFEAVDFLLNN